MEKKSENKKLLPTIIFFITLSLVAQLVIISFSTNSTTKKTIQTKAQESQCPKILPVGSNIAANNSPANYQQIRALYNSQNPKDPCVSKAFIPVTVTYDLFFLKGDSQGIVQNLQELSKNGLFPVIRVASYMKGDTWIKLYPPTDASLIGENLGKALDAVKGNFPVTPIVVYLNEVNLYAEWEGDGKKNPEEFAESFDAFYKGLSKGSNFALFFPPLSYGATGANGIAPKEFLNRFFASKKFTGKLSGTALNIYGQDYKDISNQFNSQRGVFSSGKEQIPTVITELGPIRNGTAVSNCENDKKGWQSVASPIATGVIKNNLALATMACFGSVTYPAIVHYDGSEVQLVGLANTSGQIKNNTPNTATTANTNTNNNVNNNTKTNTNTGGLTFNPQNPSPGGELRVTASSKTTLVWVNLAGVSPNGEKINLAGKTPVITRDSQGYHWTYTVENVKKGTYNFVFSDHCDKYNKQGQPLAEVCGNPIPGKITVGENNTQQTGQTQTNQNQTQTQQDTKQVTQQTQTHQTTQNNNTQTQQQKIPQNNVFDANLCNEKIQVPGPKQFKLNIIFLASNYGDLNKFLNDAKSAAASMNKTNLGQNRVNKINFWAYKNINAALSPKSCESIAGFNTVCIDEDLAKKITDDCGMDGYVVIVDDSRKAASTVALGTIQVTMTSAVLESLPHELGHGIASLFDEYDFQDDRAPNLEAAENCSANFSGNENTACPEWKKYSNVGCYSRCGFWSWYKPTTQSIMNRVQESYIFNPPSLNAWDFALQKYDKYQ